MKQKSGIEWTEKTWNPTTGCDRVSPGCENCYALDLAASLKRRGSAKYQNDGDAKTSGPGFKLTLHEKTLLDPLKWKQPQIVFVNSMSDLFHPDVPPSFIERVLGVCRDTPRHTYQILTKRSQRLKELAPMFDWPSNVWMGVSVENQRYAFRSRHLAETVGPKLKFLSVEPLVGPVDVLPLDGIDWVIVGGESGPKARRMEPEWLYQVVDQVVGPAGNQAASNDRPLLFVKQWGAWIPTVDGMRKTNKKNTLPPIYGRVWDEMPEITWQADSNSTLSFTES